MSARKKHWDGFYNARDLGGLPIASGGETRFGAYVRSADLRFTSEDGLQAAYDEGFRTVIDLRNDFETRTVPRTPEEAQANAHRVPPTPQAVLPEGMFGVRIALDDTGNLEFWERMRAERRLGTPRFFAPVMRETPHRVHAVLKAMAAAPGGVIYHCAVGRDRTGLVSFALLTLAGVEPEAIAADYAHSRTELVPFFDRLDFPQVGDRIDAVLAEIGHTLESSVLEALEGFDAWTVLRRAGLTDAELEALVAPLV